MCRSTKTYDGAAEIKGNPVSAAKRFVVGKNIKSRLYLADKGKNTILFDTERADSAEYPLIKVAAVLIFGLAAAMYTFVSLRNGARRKKKIRLQAKEIKRLKKLCAESEVCRKK